MRWLSIVTISSSNYAGLDLTKPWERSVQAGTVLWWVMGGSSQWFSVNSWLTGVFCTAKTFILSGLTSYKNDHSIFEQSLPEWMEEKCSGSVCLLRKQSLIFHLIYLVLSRIVAYWVSQMCLGCSCSRSYFFLTWAVIWHYNYQSPYPFIIIW